MPYRLGKLAAIVALLFGLAGCMPPPRTTVSVIGDKFSSDVTLEGVPLHDPTNGVDLFWMLRSFVNPHTHTASHQIYVEWTYTGQSSGRYRAADDTARPLSVENLYKESCRFNKCPRTDTVGIAIDEATLRRRAATGFQVKLTGQDGYSGILDITSQMISAQLQAEDQAFHAGSVGTAVAAANPEVVKEANDAAVQLDRFFNARYRITAAAVSACARNRIVPTSGVTLLTLSALTTGTRAPMLAAYPWLSDDVSVVHIAQTSPAERAGLRPGDVIISINGKEPAKGASGPESASKLIEASSEKPWRTAILRNGTQQDITVTPVKACGVILEFSKDATAGLNDFIRSEDEEAAILAFALAMQIGSGSDLELDKTSLTIASRADYTIDGVPNLWQRLADAKAPLALAHPVTAERLVAMRREISSLEIKAAVRIPYDPNAPGTSPTDAPQNVIRENGIGIGAIPILGSKIKSGNLADGLMISSVQKGSPAAAAGIRLGDVMTSFDGHSLTDVMTAASVFKDAAAKAVGKAQPGAVVPVEIVRNGHRMNLTIRL
jgi:S1-C subfamily serine protease